MSITGTMPGFLGGGGGPVAGIVIAVIVGTALIAGLAYLMLKKKTKTAEIVPA